MGFRIGWWVIGHSISGAAHQRTGRPNQDAIRWWPQEGKSPRVIAAVADGHGSSKCPRSAQGAALAVGAAVWVLREFADSQPESDGRHLTAVKRAAEDRLLRALVRRWRDAVHKHAEEEPLTPEEMAASQFAGKDAAADPASAYGTTLVCCLVTEQFILYLQLGDGDIVTVSDRGEVHRPLPKDERLFANETTSLSSKDAWAEFRVAFRPLVEPPPALILLSTDGYANSFRDEAGFLKVGPDLLDMLRTDGLDKVAGGLNEWLTEASSAGSGDDVTLAVVCGLPILPDYGKAIPEICDRLVRAVDPDKIILFGSRARGDHRPDSDIDLLLIKDSDVPREKRTIPAYQALRGMAVPKDILMWTPQEIDEWKDVRPHVISRAMREGKVLYEKSH